MKLSKLVAHMQGLLEYGDREVYIYDMEPFEAEDTELETVAFADPDKYPDGFVHIGEW